MVFFFKKKAHTEILSVCGREQRLVFSDTLSLIGALGKTCPSLWGLCYWLKEVV